MYTTTKLVRVEDDRKITRQDDFEFIFELQRGVLLSLREAGTLTQMQYRNAEELLKEQRRAIIRAKVEQGGNAE